MTDLQSDAKLVFPEVSEVRHLTRYHTERYLDFLRRDHSAATYNNRLCVLREVHRNVMERAAAKTNPWDGFPLRADDSHTRRELTIEELARLVDMASREGPEWRTLFGIAMYTGLRLGDCCKLTWAEVDIVRSVIQKVPEASFHSLRHTFVSMSANAGVPLHIVQSIVGHESQLAVATVPVVPPVASSSHSPLPIPPVPDRPPIPKTPFLSRLPFPFPTCPLNYSSA